MPLALEWGLFDTVDKLATSMSSEDHTAVISILRSLVMLLCNGLFDDVLCLPGPGDRPGLLDEASLKRLVEECDGKIRTKWALLGHVKYYLQYLYAVSPTEAELFGDVYELLNKVEQYSNNQAPGDENIKNVPVHLIEIDDVEITDVGPDTSHPAESALLAVSECVLCKFNVSGESLF